MLRLNCPFCGLRDQAEFSFGGENHRLRPPNPDQANDAEWAEYQFYRVNPKGLQFERWVHRFGCRQWFNVVRDTVTHEIVEICRIGEQPETALPEEGAQK
jgi:sarcosine oxidase subunit delta